jgi:hypothetical protein
VTDEEIKTLSRDFLPDRARDSLSFARAIIAQARAELVAGLKSVAYMMPDDLDELARTGRRAVVIYNESLSHLDVALAIIPKD